jgi:hypothetical protein
MKKRLLITVMAMFMLFGGVLMRPVNAEQPGFWTWKVTCNYNGQNQLISMVCESGSTKPCSCETNPMNY